MGKHIPIHVEEGIQIGDILKKIQNFRKNVN